jgi:hypothetical protein
VHACVTGLFDVVMDVLMQYRYIAMAHGQLHTHNSFLRTRCLGLWAWLFDFCFVFWNLDMDASALCFAVVFSHATFDWSKHRKIDMHDFDRSTP